MANPQQPELRRSEQVPALHPDAMEAVLEAQGDKDLDAGASPSAGGVHEQPEDRGEADQDKPDLDDFAAKFGIAKPTDEADDDENDDDQTNDDQKGS